MAMLTRATGGAFGESGSLFGSRCVAPDFRSGSSPLPPRSLGSFASPTLFFSLITSKACSDRDGTATDFCEEAAR